MDREAPSLFGGPHFQWEPGPFGPKAPSLLVVMDELAGRGFIKIMRLGRQAYGIYRLTDRGQAIAAKAMKRLKASARDWLRGTCQWVTSTDTLQLVEDEIPTRYPEMIVRAAKPIPE